ncbi:MAG TPA: phosphoribosyltransferase [Candidatus Eisenbacteria bacterium]|nr:phosphoribosyltransferase [Candidatus Eisenbacteria bacterium]
MDQLLEYEAPTWTQIYTMLLDLADKTRNSSFKPDIIVGVSRGGWLPARVLSDLLSNPSLASVGAELYVGVSEPNGKAVITQPVSTSVKGKKVLIVDEVVDTGKTLELVKEYVAEQGAAAVRIATVYWKPWSTVKPDFFEKETDRWIVFPWETKETVRKIMKKCRKGRSPFQLQKVKLLEAGVPKALFNRFLKEITEEDRC